MISQETRDEFMEQIYNIFSNESTNDLANRIIDIFDNSINNCFESPVKIGDKVYITNNHYLGNNNPSEMIVVSIQFNNINDYNNNIIICKDDNGYCHYYFSHIDKILFLNKELAIQKLNG